MKSMIKSYSAFMGISIHGHKIKTWNFNHRKNKIVDFNTLMFSSQLETASFYLAYNYFPLRIFPSTIL